MPEDQPDNEPTLIRGASTKRTTYYSPTSNLPSVLLFSLFLVLGLLLLHKKIPHLQDRRRLERDGIQTTGMIESTGGGRRCTRSITVRFEDIGKHAWHKNFDVTCSQYHSGQTVEVIYLPAEPATAMLGQYEAGIPQRQDAIGAVIGGCLTIFGGVFALRFFFRRPPGLNLQ